MTGPKPAFAARLFASVPLASPARDAERLRRIGHAVATARLEANLSQEGLAGLADVSRQTVNRIEVGRRGTRVTTLGRLADALGVPLSDLLP